MPEGSEKPPRRPKPTRRSQQEWVASQGERKRDRFDLLTLHEIKAGVIIETEDGRRYEVGGISAEGFIKYREKRSLKQLDPLRIKIKRVVGFNL